FAQKVEAVLARIHITVIDDLESVWKRLEDTELLEDKYKKMAEELSKVREDNARLKDDNSRFQAKLAGLDNPPCWRGADNKAQYILNIEIRENGLYVTRAWPDDRSNDV